MGGHWHRYGGAISHIDDLDENLLSDECDKDI